MIVKDYISDRGLKRDINEDSYIIDNQNNFIIVSDGMGGHEKGDIASKLVINTFNKYILDYSSNEEINNFEEFKDNITAYLNRANQESTDKIISYSKKHNITKIMGATIVGMIVNSSIKKIVLFHLGDSRIYRIRDKTIKQLTIDHTARNEFNGKDNVLSKAIGNFEVFELEIQFIDYNDKDLYTVCSDGIYNFIKDENVLEIINNKKDYCKNIKEVIFNNGAKDNLTLVIVEV